MLLEQTLVIVHVVEWLSGTVTKVNVTNARKYTIIQDVATATNSDNFRGHVFTAATKMMKIKEMKPEIKTTRSVVFTNTTADSEKGIFATAITTN